MPTLLDRNPDRQKVERMKITLDLPSDLVREIRLRAAHEGRKLRDVATEIFLRGLSAQAQASSSSRSRVQIPLIHPAPVSVRPHDFGAAPAGLDLSRLNQLLDELEVEDYLGKVTNDDSSGR
jgi:hypothetical protein